MRAADPHDRDEPPRTALLRSAFRGIGAVTLAVLLLLAAGAAISLTVALAY